MIARPLVSPLSLADLDRPYNLFIAVLGFEQRSRHLAEIIRPQARTRIACAFPDRKILSYRSNSDWFKRAGYEIIEVEDREFEGWFLETLARVQRDDTDHYNICIDISSMSRYRIASILDLVRKQRVAGSMSIDFIYNMAQFSPPPTAIAPNLHVGPVCSGFAGWSTEPDQPPIGILGLGYEESRALGALEHIQASDFWIFTPLSNIHQYHEAMLAANASLLESTPIERIVKYVVEEPFDCFVKLEIIAEKLRTIGNPLIFPFGPKIFALCSILVACLYDEIAVWRVSPGILESPTDRLPTDSFFGLRVRFTIFENLL
jgi:hypothetical protein